MDHYTDCDHCGKAIHDGPYYSNINFIGDHVICDCCKNQIELADLNPASCKKLKRAQKELRQWKINQ